MIRMSMMRNTPVILGERQIGLLQGIRFDHTRKRVCALIASGGMHGKRIVQTQHIRAIGSEFILVDGWSKYRRSDKQQTALFVRDTTGLLVGCVTDYAIDKKTLEVLAIEVLPGYLPWEAREKIWVFAYNFLEDTGELSIPIVLCSEPNFSEEGSRRCEYPP